MERNPLWYKHAIIYQLNVRGFYDSNDDGIGDFPGLIAKLDYLESLGITALWLLPFYPSPLKDEGYDIANYLAVNPTYGTLRDFRLFLREAHRRRIHVITELIINHTSDQHPWFQRARHAQPGSIWRDFYVWSETTDRYKEARVIFKDFETSNWAWDPIAKAYYWHRFYSHQPDLNFDNPLVQKEIFRTVDYWLAMGVDGLRLDAIPYLFEREGTNCENLEPTHAFIKQLRKRVDSKFQDRVLIAEANQWPEDAAIYFGQEDECRMAFHFPLMPRLFMALQMEDRFPIIDILEQTPVLPNSCQWIIFLRNHDELTLEMVSDEERDYMYRIYAKDPKARLNVGIRRRLAPLLDNDRAKIELMNILLVSLPGTPVIYYGDEIGMGDNYYLGDRNGVRTPMQWSSDRNAGFSRSNPQKLYLPMIIDPPYHYEVVNVENQEQNPSSLLWWIRKVFLLHKNHKAFGFGSLEFVPSSNHRVLSFTRTHENEIILVVANLSRFPQATELDLSKYAGYVLRELFHQNPFPPPKEEPYSLTLGPYNYFWISLQPATDLARLVEEKESPKIIVEKRWENILKGVIKQKLQKEILPRFLKSARWFERKTCTIQNVKIIGTIPLANAQLCFLEVSYLEIEDIDTYLLPISFAVSPESEQIVLNTPQGVITYVQVNEKEGLLYDALYSDSFRNALIQMIYNHKKIKNDMGELSGFPGENLKKGILKNEPLPESSQVINLEQSNSAITYGQKLFLKIFRRLEEGIHPDIEMERFLTDKIHFQHIPPFAGSIEWKRKGSQTTAIALLEGLVMNQGTAWVWTVDLLTGYYERVLALKDADEQITKIKAMEPSEGSATENRILEDLIGVSYIESIRLLARRTAEMHLALTSETDNPNFNPEPFSLHYQRSLYQNMRRNARATFQLIKKNIKTFPEKIQNEIEKVAKIEPNVLDFFQKILQKKLAIMRTRIHGDYHLGQVLYTGKDFCIIDFEGEPLHSLTARRLKRSPLQDVAGMIRSFHYAAYKAVFFNTGIRPEEVSKLEHWATLWYKNICEVFLQAYFRVLAESPLPLVPKESADREYLIQAFTLEKAIYELAYDINSRPDWAIISCKGILQPLF